jgi:hydrogenase maturation protease
MQEVASPIQTLVIGLGSHHGADAIGWLIARALKRLDSTLPVVEAATPSDMLDLMQQKSRLIICDGCKGAGEPGSAHHWRWPHFDLQPQRSSGTHNLTLDEVLRLAETLETIPLQIDLWGIELPIDSPTADSQWLLQVASRAALRIHTKLNHA